MNSLLKKDYNPRYHNLFNALLLGVVGFSLWENWYYSTGWTVSTVSTPIGLILLGFACSRNSLIKHFSPILLIVGLCISNFLANYISQMDWLTFGLFGLLGGLIHKPSMNNHFSSALGFYLYSFAVDELGFAFPYFEFEFLLSFLLVSLIIRNSGNDHSVDTDLKQPNYTIALGAQGGILCMAILNYLTPIANPNFEQCSQTIIILIVLISIKGLFIKWLRPLKYSLILLIPFVWILCGYASVQSFEGFTFLICGLGFIALITLTIPYNPYSLLGFGIGCLTHTLYSSDFSELNGLIIVALIWITFSKQFRTIIAIQIAILIFCWTTSRGPTLAYVYPSVHFQTIQPRRAPSDIFWSSKGWLTFEPPQNSPKMSKDVTYRGKAAVIFDNTPLNRRSKEFDNERTLAAFIKKTILLVGQITIINDHSGIVNTELGSEIQNSIICHSSIPTLTQVLAEQFPDRKSSWLSPNRLLTSKNAEQTIVSMPSSDVVIETIYYPWASALSPDPSTKHWELIHSKLKPDGRLFVIVHLAEFPDGAIEYLTEELKSVFQYTQLHIPPENIESVLIIAQNSPFIYSKWKAYFNEAAHQELGRTLATSFPKNMNLSKPIISQRPPIPIAHLTTLGKTQLNPEEVWDEISADDRIVLRTEMEHHAEFLNLINDGIKGGLNSIKETNLPANLKLSLIEPHIKSAKKHIYQAQNEGQSSSHWQQASRYALTAQMIAPEETEPWLLLGDIALGEGILDKALEKFNTVLEMDRESIPALNGLARIYGLQENWTSAEEMLLKAQSVAPNLWLTHYNLAIFYQQRELIDNVFPLLTQAIELPNGDNYKTRIAFVEYFIAQERWTRGLIEIDRLIQESEPTAEMWFLRGRIHFGLELWSKAEADFQKSTLADPNFHAARGSIGVIKMIQGDLQGAAQAFRATLRFDPNNETARKNLQIVQEQLSTSQ